MRLTEVSLDAFIKICMKNINKNDVLIKHSVQHFGDGTSSSIT